jgi:hypothetical protein
MKYSVRKVSKILDDSLEVESFTCQLEAVDILSRDLQKYVRVYLIKEIDRELYLNGNSYISFYIVNGYDVVKSGIAMDAYILVGSGGGVANFEDLNSLYRCEVKLLK